MAPTPTVPKLDLQVIKYPREDDKARGREIVRYVDGQIKRLNWLRRWPQRMTLFDMLVLDYVVALYLNDQGGTKRQEIINAIPVPRWTLRNSFQRLTEARLLILEGGLLYPTQFAQASCEDLLAQAVTGRIQRASEEVVAELDQLAPKHRERIETRLRRESEALEKGQAAGAMERTTASQYSLSMPPAAHSSSRNATFAAASCGPTGTCSQMSVTGEERRAKEFLDTWLAAHVRPGDGNFDEQVSRLLQKLVVDAVQADIPGLALFRIAGGDLVAFMADVLRRARPHDGSQE